MDVFGTPFNTDPIRSAVSSEINSKVPSIKGILHTSVYANSRYTGQYNEGSNQLPKVTIPSNGFGIQRHSNGQSEGVTFLAPGSTGQYGNYQSGSWIYYYDLLVVWLT